MSMPHLNFLDIWGSRFKKFQKNYSTSNRRLKIPAKLFLQSSIFNLRFEVGFQVRNFLKLLKLLPQMSKKVRCGMDI